jgi:dipeptidyl aminopeptidase/acylaminoacyl peptidase
MPIGRRPLLRLAVSSTLGAAAHLSPPALRLATPSRAQTIGVTSLPAGRLAYLLGGHLWVVGAGGAERRVAVGTGGWIQDPAWSPDGARIAYAHVRFPLTPPPGGGIPWPSSDVYVASPDTLAEPTLAVRRESPNDTLVSPAWSPDGRYLYVIRRRPLDTTGLSVAVDLLRVDAITGERLPLPLPAEPVEVVTAPDGTLLIVTIEGTAYGPTVSRLLRLAPDLATPPTELLVAGQALGGFLTLPRVSPSGQRLTFAAGGDAPPPAASRTMLDTLFDSTAEAHGARGWPYALDLATGALRRAPTDGHDDLVGLAWLDERHIMLLDAGGLGILDVQDGSLLRVPAISATGFAWVNAA